MCGIMGYIGFRPAGNILLDGLERLSYRGYDSAGLALHDGSALQVIKTSGRIDALRKKCAAAPMHGTVGIGHTRWATHGAASEINAHPQLDARRRIALVHNGVIENHAQLRSMLIGQGVSFVSDTDTECIVHLLRMHYDGDMLRALRACMQHLKGSYALSVLCADDLSAVYCLRAGSPLALGMNDGESYVASDIPALLPCTQNVLLLENGEAAVLRRTGIQVVGRTGQRKPARPLRIAWQPSAAEKGAYPHFMLKEICEQPQVLSAVAAQQQTIPAAPAQALLLGCGTAYHAGLLGAYYLEQLAHLPARAEIASEYRASIPSALENCACIAVSQSGETADTLHAAHQAREHGAQPVALTNAPGSSLQRMAAHTLLTPAGPEMSVASTKAYTAQALSLFLLALKWGRQRGALSAERFDNILQQVQLLPQYAEEALQMKDALQAYIVPRAHQPLFFFIGRGPDAVTAREAALKFKEITYIPAESCPAGELKHGPIALISRGTPVIALCTQPEHLQKTLVSVAECRARGAECCCFCLPGMAKEAQDAADHVFVLPSVSPLLAPLVSVLPMQLLAYYAACARGRDVDKPRNLAKSVTVE